MRTVNRLAIAVTPLEPYLAWAKSIDEGAAALDISAREFTTVYLVDATETFEPEQLLRKHYRAIFAEQLHSWHTDAARWPAARTYELFMKWFDAMVVDMVWDLGRGHIVADD